MKKNKLFCVNYQLIETKIANNQYWLEAEDESQAHEYMSKAIKQHAVETDDYKRNIENISINETEFEYETLRWKDVELVGFKVLLNSGDEEDAQYYFDLAELLEDYNMDEAYTHYVGGDTSVRESVPKRVKQLFTIMFDG